MIFLKGYACDSVTSAAVVVAAAAEMVSCYYPTVKLPVVVAGKGPHITGGITAGCFLVRDGLDCLRF